MCHIWGGGSVKETLHADRGTDGIVWPMMHRSGSGKAYRRGQLQEFHLTRLLAGSGSWDGEYSWPAQALSKLFPGP